MSRGFKVFAIALIPALVGLFFRFGTLHPCGMLKQEMKSQVLRDMTSGINRTYDKWEGLGIGLGVALSNPMIDAMVDGLTPLQCGQLLYQTVTGEFSLADKHPSPTMTSSTGASSSPPTPPSWQMRQETSKIDDSTNVYLSIDANEPINDWLKQTVTPSLVLRCLEGKTHAYLDLKMQPTTDYDDGEHYAPVTVRFDKDQARRQRMSVATDYKAIFFPEPIPTIKTMLQRKILVVQFTQFQGGITTLSFDLAGLYEQIGPLQKACRWK